MKYDHYIYEFDSKSYFKDENSTIYFILTEASLDPQSHLHIYYDKNKINISKNRVYNSDLNFTLFYHLNKVIQFSSNNCSFIYFVIINQGPNIQW